MGELTKEEQKIIIAGSRNFNDYELALKTLNTLLSLENFQIVSGHAPGADQLGERFAADNNLNLVIFPANWNKYGRSAGPIRNAQMAKYAEGGTLVLFWDGKSAGSKNMLENAKKYNLKIIEVLI